MNVLEMKCLESLVGASPMDRVKWRGALKNWNKGSWQV